LEVALTSPQGTSSVLLPGNRPESTQLEKGKRWKLLTVRNWDESPIGEWTLSIVDLKVGDTYACVSRAWTFLSEDIEATCVDLEKYEICKDGALDPFDLLTTEKIVILGSWTTV
jgi:subtilisin-like proprotein convertase family protein